MHCAALDLASPLRRHDPVHSCEAFTPSQAISQDMFITLPPLTQAPAERMIRDCVACELAYINTDHPAFIGGNRAIAAVLGGGQSDASDGDESEDPNGAGGAHAGGSGHHSHHHRQHSGGVRPSASAGTQCRIHDV